MKQLRKLTDFQNLHCDSYYIECKYRGEKDADHSRNYCQCLSPDLCYEKTPERFCDHLVEIKKHKSGKRKVSPQITIDCAVCGFHGFTNTYVSIDILRMMHNIRHRISLGYPTNSDIAYASSGEFGELENNWRKVSQTFQS